MTRGRRSTAFTLAATLAFAVAMGTSVSAQAQKPKSAADVKASLTPAKTDKQADQPVGTLVESTHLVSPNEPIAVVNGEPITRAQLADECVALKGEEILDALIARKMIEQAVRNRKITITQAEIDAEIERVANNVAGVSRDKWLATLSKERKISPSRYARDVIYPSLALRKLAEPLVQVTEKDMKDAFEAKFGEQIRCRMITCATERIAIQTWEELKKDPSLFEKYAQEKSTDPATRSLGGMLPQAITRHAYPLAVSDKLFEQLVDADRRIDPKSPNFEQLKPKDGTISAVIQITTDTWAIFQRVSVLPARPYDAKDPSLIAGVRETMFEAKLQEMINQLVGGMMRDSAIENRLTGQVKLSKEESMRTPDADPQVQRTGNTSAMLPATANAAAVEAPKTSSGLTGGATVPTGVSAEDVKKVDSIKKK